MPNDNFYTDLKLSLTYKTHGTYRSPSNSTNKLIDLIFFLVFFLLKVEISVINFPVIHVFEHTAFKLLHTLPTGTI